MKRIQALKIIDDFFAIKPLVITCGATARELASFSKRDSHLPLLDSMGLTSPIGLGVALGSSVRVGVIDGDGSLLMGFSILPTLAAYSASNLTIVVLDNGQHASADQVPSQAATLELAGAAEGLGLNTIRCSDQTGLEAALAKSAKENVFAIIFAKIEPGNSPDIPLLLADPAVLAQKFANFVGISARL